MSEGLETIRDIILGFGALSMTIVIVLIIRLMGGIKEEHEKGTRLTNSQIIESIIWIVLLVISLIWAILKS